jgi:hypothetical protein
MTKGKVVLKPYSDSKPKENNIKPTNLEEKIE